MTNEEIVKKIIATEKSDRLHGQNRYAVEVAADARKPQIAKAVEEMYGVHVLAVRTVSVKGGKRYVRGTRRVVEEPLRKKAYVTLKDNEHLGENA